MARLVDRDRARLAVVLLMCFANLRGLREAGRTFALPTYFFVGMVSLTIMVGIIRILGNLGNTTRSTSPGRCRSIRATA